MENRSANVTAYIPELRRYARALLRDPVEAEDLVQECLCRAIARARPWRLIRDLRAYLFTIMHNLYVDRIAKKANGHDIVSDEMVERKLVAKPSQLDHLEVRDLAGALDKLSTEQREVILLIGLEGMSYEDAARILDIPNGTVMSRLSRGREALRRLLDGGDRNDARSSGTNVQSLPSRRVREQLRGRG